MFKNFDKYKFIHITVGTFMCTFRYQIKKQLQRNDVWLNNTFTQLQLN